MLNLAALFLICIFQVGSSQMLPEAALDPAAGYAGWGRPGFPGPNNYMPSYGGEGVGDISVVGEMPVAGSTALLGQVPVSGNVQFCGKIPASAVFAVSGSCSCGLNGAMIS